MPSTYRTIQGDTWDLIAWRELGSEKYLDRLLDANPAYRETLIFPANAVLTIPDVDAATLDGLPPWKRGDEG